MQKSIRQMSSQDSYRKTSARFSANHTVICISITQNENRHYSACLCRSSKRHKRCDMLDDVAPSEESYPDAAFVDFICKEFRHSLFMYLYLLVREERSTHGATSMLVSDFQHTIL